MLFKKIGIKVNEKVDNFKVINNSAVTRDNWNRSNVKVVKNFKV